MAEPVASLATTTMNCDDQEELAEFWSALLGGKIIYRSEKAIVLNTPRGALGFLHIADYQPPTWPDNERRVYLHLDLATADREAARARAIRLGARVAEHQPSEDGSWEVLLDPAGHPFCFAAVPPGWPPQFDQSTED